MQVIRLLEVFILDWFFVDVFTLLIALWILINKGSVGNSKATLSSPIVFIIATILVGGPAYILGTSHFYARQIILGEMSVYYWVVLILPTITTIAAKVKMLTNENDGSNSLHSLSSKLVWLAGATLFLWIIGAVVNGLIHKFRVYPGFS